MSLPPNVTPFETTGSRNATPEKNGSKKASSPTAVERTEVPAKPPQDDDHDWLTLVDELDK
jgi:hypothetical protein